MGAAAVQVGHYNWHREKSRPQGQLSVGAGNGGAPIDLPIPANLPRWISSFLLVARTPTWRRLHPTILPARFWRLLFGRNNTLGRAGHGGVAASCCFGEFDSV
jgi:hypothetical protein